MINKQQRTKNVVTIQAGITQAFRIINELDLDYMIQALENDLTVSPFKDPILFKMKGRAGEKWLRLAQIMKQARDDMIEEFSTQTLKRN